MISLHACIIYTLSIHNIEVINFSKFHILSINNSFVLNLAQGLPADIASAAATIRDIGLVNSTSK
jgi:hypothetical protein